MSVFCIVLCGSNLGLCGTIILLVAMDPLVSMVTTLNLSWLLPVATSENTLISVVAPSNKWLQITVVALGNKYPLVSMATPSNLT